MKLENYCRKTLCLVLLGMLVFTILMPAVIIKPVLATWWNNGWLYRKSITINHTKVIANLTNFPVLISVTDSDLASKAQDDGDDIVFTDYGGTKLNHEIEFFNGATGKLVAWVKVPTLSSTADTVLYMYYGNSIAPNQQNVTAVWVSDYRMVQHLNEASGTHYDSTAYGNNGTYYGSQQNSTGKIDGADGFVGNFGLTGGDYVDCGNDTSLNINDAITVSAWIKPDDQTQWNHITTKGHGEWDVDANRVYQLSIQPDETIDFIINSNRTVKAITAMSVPIGEWSYAVGTYDRNYIKVYINGVERASSSYTELIQNNTVNLRIASRVKGTGNTGPPAYTFDGYIDEVRISDIARSQAWLQTEYNNQYDPDSFYTIGSESILPVTVFVSPSTVYAFVGQEFEVNVSLDFASKLYGYEVWLSFDNSKLNATAINYKGYLNEPTLMWHQEVNNTGGYVALAYSSRYPATGKTGGSPPPLATIHFKAIGTGTSPLHLYKTVLSDDQARPMLHTTIDGEVTCLTLPNNPPIAENLTITPLLPLTTDNLLGSYDYYDAEADPENGTEIRWYKNDALQPGLNDTLTVSSGLTTKGETWYFTVKPKDGIDFGTLKTSPSVTIQNSPPTIDSFTPTDTTPEVNAGESLEFTHISSDPDNDPLTYSWLLDSIAQATTQNWTYSPGYDDAGIHNVTIIVSDGELVDSQEWNVTVYARDIAVISIELSATEAYPTWVKPLYINVTVKNNGTRAETFTVTAYYNNTPIDTKTVTNLLAGNETTLTFTWNIPNIPKAFPYPIYIISANASFVPDEINTTNNHLSDGAVTVKWPGDINGNGYVNLLDLSLLADHWFNIPHYDPQADINMDGFINLSDLSILADNWFKGPKD